MNFFIAAFIEHFACGQSWLEECQPDWDKL